MFTGIIQSTSTVHSAINRGAVHAVRIKTPKRWKIVLGQSIAVDGICSTVVNITNGFFEVEYMPETLSKTTAHLFKKNSVLNLERSLTLKSLMDGHMVMGHVDAESVVLGVDTKEQATSLTIQVPKTLTKYIAPQGSITINGVSLTISKQDGVRVTVALIPYTLLHTNLGLLKINDRVNTEVDLFARYIVNATSHATVLKNAKKTLQ